MHNVPKDEVFVIGHKNPDTDSICSAIAYANLKNQTEDKYIPKRAGNINKETEFVLNYFGLSAPELVQDVNMQVKDIAYRLVEGVSETITMKKAFDLMHENDATTLPIVSHGKVKGIVTVGDIARTHMADDNAYILHDAGTKFQQIIETIDGKLVCGNGHGYVPKGKVIVGAAHVERMEQYVNVNDIVILSDRKESQLRAIEKGACMIIVCLVDEVPEQTLALAEQYSCVVAVTNNDTYTTARLIGQSIPVQYFMQRDPIMTFYEDDSIDTLKSTMARTRVRYFPVIDGNGNYLGLVSRRNYINARRKQLILVDHNEKTQSVNHVEKADILEIIDHHRIANVETMNPVYFRNQPLGCTATIIYQMYQEQNLIPDRATAGILCAAILSDTLLFQSPTCTPLDEAAARKLAEIAGIVVEEFAMEMFDAGSNLKGKTMDEILHQDFKKFDIGEHVVAIGQINSINKKELEEIRQGMYDYLSEHPEPGCDMTLFIMTDILADGSGILCFGEDAGSLCELAFGETFDDHFAYLDGVVSRKKQVVPSLIGAMHGSL